MPDLTALYHHLVRFETELWGAVDARLRAECGLPLPWFEIMRSLGARPGMRVQDLAEEFVITVSGTSKVVDKVENAGYCHRLPNPDDRRSALLHLTPEGKRVLASATKAFEEELERRFLPMLTGPEVDRMTSNLVALRTRFSTAGKRPTS